MADYVLTAKEQTTKERNSADEPFKVFLQMDYENINNSSYAAPAGTNILDLDDDSLLLILKLLSLKDQLLLVCAHLRFSLVFQMHAKASIREITEYDLERLTPLGIRYFFEIAGEYLQSLTLLTGFEKTNCEYGFTLVKLHCPNLKYLSLWGKFDETLEDVERFRQLLLNKPKLRTLRLQRLCLKDDYINVMLKADLPQFEHLSIVNCSEFSGTSLKQLTNLKKLRLENLKQLKYSVLKDVLSVLPNLYALSYLEADETYDFSDNFVEVLNELQNFNRRLEIVELNMHNTRSVHVEQLPKLKHFTYGIRDNNWLTTLEFSELLKQKKHELESLRILSFWDFQFNALQCNLISQFTNLKKLHLPWKDLSKHGIIIDDESLRHLCALENLVEFKACGPNSFTKDGLLDLVRKCRKLKWVNIQCSLIDNKFTIELVTVVEEEGKRPNGPITFLVYASKIHKNNFPEVYNSKEMKQFAEFIFEELFTLESYNNFYDDFEHDCNFIRTPFCSYW